MIITELINKKKLGLPLNQQEINFICYGYLNDSISDAQISSLLMAICLKGMNSDETFYLTKQISDSGRKLTISSKSPIIDKHSTGGVGDKISIILAPIMASVGLTTAKLSGRGLSYTGGTIDKLEAIPNFIIAKPECSNEIIKECNFVISNHSNDITPLDTKLYALRDITATVDSIPLIATSIMGKKLAINNSKMILLDIKVGNGAFMKNIDTANQLAQTMLNIGTKFNKKVGCLLTNMEQPLGYSIGNAVEVIEAIEYLKGNCANDIKQIIDKIITIALLNQKLANNETEAITKINNSIKSGNALKILAKFINKCGGNNKVINDYSLFNLTHPFEIKSQLAGYITQIHAQSIGLTVMKLGAGRQNKGDVINHKVGLVLNKKCGDYVKKHETLAKLYAINENQKQQANKQILQAIEISNQPNKITQKTIFKYLEN